MQQLNLSFNQEFQQKNEQEFEQQFKLHLYQIAQWAHWAVSTNPVSFGFPHNPNNEWEKSRFKL